MGTVIQSCAPDEQAPGATSPESASDGAAPTPAVRCAQCGWTISPRRLEMVEHPEGFIFLHRGGCPTPEPAEDPC